MNARGCSEDGCDRPVRCRGVCTRHYRRLHYVEHERARRGASAAKVTSIGDTRINSGGYVEEKGGPGGRDWSLQHRMVIESQIGRSLMPDETVHHRNGDKTDNRLENLELWSSRHPKGQRIEDLLAFAAEIIDLYGKAA